MTVFLTKEFFTRANKGDDARKEAATVARPETKSVSELVLTIVQSIAEEDLCRVADLSAGIAFQPRPLLALITCCYARGVYASQDIEDLMRRDAAFRCLCVNEFPDWRVLRRFRRKNRGAIQHCLAQTLHQLHEAANRIGPAQSALGRQGREWSMEDSFEQEAEARLHQATFIDSMGDNCDGR